VAQQPLAGDTGAFWAALVFACGGGVLPGEE
jgi:hypothetical protein